MYIDIAALILFKSLNRNDFALFVLTTKASVSEQGHMKTDCTFRGR